ncbi:hypothetical protein F5884DRAFT_78901 [Xylogone sp. PMI_703]|nr:hypothetical protein F5884DRAFT_78901 [Xylogone sp. PMI_703]
MFATRALRQAAHAERVPLIKFLGKRTIPASVDHTPHPHPASPTHQVPKNFQQSSSPSFSSYRQQAQQHGPLARTIGSFSGQMLGSVEPRKGEYFDRNELPARFRRTPLDLAEIDAIETGGATLVC